MLTNTYLYADIRKTVMFLISLGVLFSAEWSMDYVCVFLSAFNQAGDARGQDLKYRPLSFFSRNTQPDISCITNVHPREEWAAHLELTGS